MNFQLESYIAVLVVSLTSLLVILLFNKLKVFDHFQNYLIALASGTLLGDVLLHIIPDIGIDKNQNLPLVILLALVFYFFLESILHIRHSHNEEDHNTTLRYGLVSSDIIHNTIDGIAIAASFSVSLSLGVATALVIILHEIPKEVGSVAVFLKSGLSIVKSIQLNLLTGLFALMGAIFVNVLPDSIKPYLLAFTAGNFLYIALADLLPEIHRENKTRKVAVISFLMFILGIFIMYLLKVANIG